MHVLQLSTFSLPPLPPLPASPPLAATPRQVVSRPLALSPHGCFHPYMCANSMYSTWSTPLVHSAGLRLRPWSVKLSPLFSPPLPRCPAPASLTPSTLLGHLRHVQAPVAIWRGCVPGIAMGHLCADPVCTESRMRPQWACPLPPSVMQSSSLSLEPALSISQSLL